MSAVSAADSRQRWIANTERLHRKGHFANYTPKLLAEVLKKGYLGRWPPDDAIRIAMQQAERGYSHRMPQFNDNMRDHGLSVKRSGRSCSTSSKRFRRNRTSLRRTSESRPAIHSIFSVGRSGARCTSSFRSPERRGSRRSCPGRVIPPSTERNETNHEVLPMWKRQNDEQDRQDDRSGTGRGDTRPDGGDDVQPLRIPDTDR